MCIDMNLLKKIFGKKNEDIFKEKFENVVNKYKNYEIQEGEQL